MLSAAPHEAGYAYKGKTKLHSLVVLLSACMYVMPVMVDICIWPRMLLPAQCQVCLSCAGKPVLPLPPAPPLPSHVRTVVGVQGESCTATCGRTNSSCAVQHMIALNHCNVLRTYFACEAGCDNTGGDIQPSYVGAEAPKEQQPTDCLIAESHTQFSCDVSHPNTQRLCPCTQGSQVTSVA